MLRFFRHHIPMLALFELVADSLLCFIAVLLAAARLPGVADATVPTLPLSQLLLPAATFAAFMALLYSFAGLYRHGVVSVSLRALLARAFVAILMGSYLAFLALESQGSGTYAYLVLLYGVPLMALGASVVRGVGYLARRASVGARRVLIVGTGNEALRVMDDLAADRFSRYSVVGFYPTGSDAAEALSQRPHAPIFSAGVSVEDVVRTHQVDEVIVAVREQRGGGVPMDQLLACRIRGIPVVDLAGFFERANGEVPTDSLKASWLIYGHGFVQGRVRTAVKRVFDLVLSTLLIVIASPVMLVTAIAIKLESAGPVIYRQERLGLYGRPFMCLKFRSMQIDAEKDGKARWATKNDARVTRVGAFIRKYRIDELPQLCSVLRGEISLIGPRPERPSFVEQLREQIPFYDIRHSVKPGITGWAQVRYTYSASVEDARRKHQFDLYYVKNNSLFLDLLVLVETVSVVLFREGAQ